MKRLATLALPVMLSIVLVLSACSSGSNKSNSSSAAPASQQASQSQSASESAKPQEVVTLRVLVMETGTKWNSFPDSPVAQAIADQIGVKIEYVEADENKFNVLLAGGDLPDIVRADPRKYGKQLIEGGLIVPMDDLLSEYGKDITANLPATIDYSKANWSEGRNQLYFLPPQVQSIAGEVVRPITIGPTVRWDFYKEIGAPAINNTDELLDALAQIVEKHPVTDEGKKVYGVSMWHDWGLWPYIFPFTFLTNQVAANTELMVKGQHEKQFISLLTNPASNFWLAMDFYYKANKRGLLDPDALTMKHDDYLAKATSGQIIYGPATWAMGDLNSKLANEGKGFMVLPVGKYAWNGGVSPLGWSDKGYSISKSSKHPEKAMEFLNYIFSYEGARTMYSGPQGQYWDIVDGKAQLKEETYALMQEGGAAWEATGIGLDINLIGLGSDVFDSAVNAPVDLRSTPEAIAKSLNALDRDFSSFYNVTQPGDIFAKLIKEDKLGDFTSHLKDQSQDYIVKASTVVTPALTDELLKLESQLKEVASRQAAKIILSKSDGEFEKNKQAAIQAFVDAGADKITEFYTAAYTKALQDAGLN